MKKKSILALKGGRPVRTEPFPAWPRIDNREFEAVREVMENRTWNQTVGQVTVEFEKRFADYHKAQEAISVTSGFDAIQISLRALGIGPGDEVIIPAYTCVADPLAVMQVNTVPVFADVEKENYCLDPLEFRKKITPHTKAVMPVHFGGNVADMPEIKRIAEAKGIFIIEDAALAQGATRAGKPVGSWADMAIFSFGDDKPMTAGRGGMIITNNKNVADKCRALRDRGRKAYDFYAGFIEEPGWNYRLSELLAAVLLAQFEKYSDQVALEQENAEYLFNKLGEIDGLRVVNRLLPDETNVIDIIMIEYDRKKIDISKEIFVQALIAEGIPSLKGYDYPLNEHPVMKSSWIQKCPVGCPYYGKKTDYATQTFPVSSHACKSCFWIWHYSVLLGDHKDMDDVYLAIRKVVENQNEL